MENLKKLVGEDVFKEHIEPKLGAEKKYFFGEGDFIPKGRFDENNTSLKQQIKDRDNQLAELKKAAAGNDELSAKLKELEEANQKQTKEYEEKLFEQEFNFNFEKLLNSANPKDTKVLAALINKDKLVYKDGVFSGFDTQIAEIKKTHDYVFNDIADPNPKPNRTGNVFRNSTTTQQQNQSTQQNPWNRRSPYR